MTAAARNFAIDSLDFLNYRAPRFLKYAVGHPSICSHARRIPAGHFLTGKTTAEVEPCVS
jgi:hypothetical protein